MGKATRDLPVLAFKAQQAFDGHAGAQHDVAQARILGIGQGQIERGGSGKRGKQLR